MFKVKRNALFDTRKSCLTKENVKLYKTQITKIENTPILSRSTSDTIRVGYDCMKNNGFCLLKEKIDV